MKLTLSWLKAHLETSATADQIVETLTRIGLEVEHVHNPADKLKDFIVAYVVEAKPHPNADRLRVCMVDTGAGAPIQVVCGAPNARTGIKGVFSPVGTYIPSKKITLTKGNIRGVDSEGMLCSAAELELSDDHDGIIELPADAPVGGRYVDYAGLNEPVIEINLTPNRPDAAGIYGIARDLAAAGLGTLKSDGAKTVDGAFACPVNVKLDFADEDRGLAPAFALRMVRGVKNGPSPDWLRKRLEDIGLRPINALVDITNYLTFDRARPLHVFDAKKVKGDLVVRRARAGEEIVALDGKTYALNPANTVICDDNGVESIAGVMGGEHSGCDEQTTDVLIESALWDPLNIARTGRDLGIVTDARYRFERGVDPAYCLPGLDLATHMVMELCGGSPSQVVLAGAIPAAGKEIDFPWSEVARLTGLEMPRAEMQAILEKLGFEVKAGAERALVKTPSWRPDVDGKADLVEEIVRIAGLERVKSTPMLRDEQTIIKPILTLLQKRTRLARRALAARGMVEALTWSFISRDQASLFGGGAAQLALANPIAADLSDMRPSLLPGLVASARRNANHGVGDVAIFEVGQIFRGAGEKDQRIAAAGVRRGAAKPQGAGRHWSGKAAPVDAFDAKADAIAMLTTLGVQTAGMQLVPGAPAWFHPGRSGTLQFGPKNIIGWFGELHPRALEALDAAGPLVAFEIILDDIPAPKSRPTKTKGKFDPPELLPVERDFAFVVDRGVKAADILRHARAAERNLVASADVFDVYEGPGVAEGKKSVAISVTMQPREKTLTDGEIDSIAQRIVAEVAAKTGAVLRG